MLSINHYVKEVSLRIPLLFWRMQLKTIYLFNLTLIINLHPMLHLVLLMIQALFIFFHIGTSLFSIFKIRLFHLLWILQSQLNLILKMTFFIHILWIGYPLHKKTVLKPAKPLKHNIGIIFIPSWAFQFTWSQYLVFSVSFWFKKFQKIWMPFKKMISMMILQAILDSIGFFYMVIFFESPIVLSICHLLSVHHLG